LSQENLVKSFQGRHLRWPLLSQQLRIYF
jgi:hypothetical protein